MAFLDDARRHPLYASSARDLPRPFYTWAVLMTSLAIWIVIAVVMSQI